ncbi:MAG: homoserine O-acetyltransferase [Halieaceae bacterium]|jgi:homoserine O-acetyltransferase
MAKIFWLVLLCFIHAGAIADSSLQLASIGDLQLESGETIFDCKIGYRTSGTLNANKSNVIVMPSWFTGTTEDLLKYKLIGPGKLADTNTYYVISIDALSNGVSSSPSNSAKQMGANFPATSVNDMVNSQHIMLTKVLDIHHAKAVIGISMGGMQTFAWMGLYPDFMDSAVPIDGSPKMTSYDLVQWKTHEAAIQLMQDANVNDETIMAFLSSLNQLTLWTPDYFVENIPSKDISAYLINEEQGYAGDDPYDYLYQLQAMIAHNVFATDNPDRLDYIETVTADVLVVGVAGDQMVNPTPGRALAKSLGATYAEIDSNGGHMGSSLEADTVATVVNSFLEER